MLLHELKGYLFSAYTQRGSGREDMCSIHPSVCKYWIIVSAPLLYTIKLLSIFIGLASKLWLPDLLV